MNSPVYDPKNPYLLDTPRKVAWANLHRNQFRVPYKLGDHAMFRPKEAKQKVASMRGRK